MEKQQDKEQEAAVTILEEETRQGNKPSFELQELPVDE
jgi:hypothetical protein